MEDPRWLRLITIGLILAALSVGYFLLSGRLTSNSSVQKVSQNNGAVAVIDASASATPTPSVLGQNAKITLTPSSSPKSSPKPTPVSAYARIVSRTQSQVQELPKTGFPEALVGIVSIGIMISGWGLCKFPK